MVKDQAFKDVLTYLDANAERLRRELFDYLRLPSISAQADHVGDIRQAAAWSSDRCTAAGLHAEVLETAGWPVVLAEGGQRAGRPTLLVYGHYDVQPEGDLSLWHGGPFEPIVQDGRIIARGAADDKGQVFCAIAAAEAWRRAVGELPINLKMCIEGEEEVGSPSLASVVQAHRQRLACDYVVVHDTPQFGPGCPAITAATRGIVSKEVILTGPKKDLHSGAYGGAVANPANELAGLIAGLHDADGRVNIPGFYDRVRQLTVAEKEMIDRLPFDEQAFLADTGSPKTYGEKGYGTLERRWTRPTLDINGVYGGYMKQGSSTIIPSQAGAKISMRLATDQRAEEIGRLFEEAVRSRVSDTVRVQIKSHGCCDPYVADLNSPGMKAARRALAIGFGREPVLTREGGSLPILPMFKAVLGADSLLIGYCQPDCNAHSPNEFLDVRDFEAGMRTSAALYGLLGGMVG